MVNDNIAATRAGEPTRDDAPFAKFPISSVITLLCALSLSLSLVWFGLSRPLLDPLLMGTKSPLSFFEDESLNS